MAYVEQYRYIKNKDRVLEIGNGAGVFKDIAEKILYFLDNPDIAKKYAYSGREMIKNRYNWETESKKLLNIYENL